MPEIITHYAVSLLISSRTVSLKYAVLLALVGLLPDIDALFRIHRWFTHSLIIASLAFLAAYVIALKLKPKASKLVITAYILYSAHIILDIFTAPTPIIWPLTSMSYMFKVGIDGIISADGVAITQNIKLDITPADFTQRPMIEGPIISETSLTTAVAVATAIVVERLMQKHTR
ncbi:MAG: metal-dependent hydrolase [Sulfolobales archaeon]